MQFDPIVSNSDNREGYGSRSRSWDWVEFINQLLRGSGFDSTPTPPPDLTATEPNAFLVASNFIQNMAPMR